MWSSRFPAFRTGRRIEQSPPDETHHRTAYLGVHRPMSTPTSLPNEAPERGRVRLAATKSVACSGESQMTGRRTATDAFTLSTRPPTSEAVPATPEVTGRRT